MDKCGTCKNWDSTWWKCTIAEYIGTWQPKETAKSGLITLLWDNRSDFYFGPMFGCKHHTARHNLQVILDSIIGKHCIKCDHFNKQYWSCYMIERGNKEEAPFGAEDRVTIYNDSKSDVIVGNFYGCIHHTSGCGALHQGR